MSGIVYNMFILKICQTIFTHVLFSTATTGKYQRMQLLFAEGLTPRLRFWGAELLHPPPCWNTGVKGLERLDKLYLETKLWCRLEVPLLWMEDSHLKKPHPFLSVDFTPEQEKKNRPRFGPGDWTILLLDRRPHLHIGGVAFIDVEVLMSGVLRIELVEFMKELLIFIGDFLQNEVWTLVFGLGTLNLTPSSTSGFLNLLQELTSPVLFWFSLLPQFCLVSVAFLSLLVKPPFPIHVSKPDFACKLLLST